MMNVYKKYNIPYEIECMIYLYDDTFKIKFDTVVHHILWGIPNWNKSSDTERIKDIITLANAELYIYSQIK